MTLLKKRKLIVENYKKSLLKKSLERKELNKDAKKQNTQKPRVPYSYKDNILLLGEGNFSFTTALMRIFEEQIQKDACFTSESQLGTIVATNFDSKQVILEKYEDVDFDTLVGQHQQQLILLYEVDATNILKSLKSSLKKSSSAPLEKATMKFEKIIFNFPHLGAGIKNEEINVRQHQTLLIKFFLSAKQVLKLPEGEIHVTLKHRKPYALWNIKTLARECGLRSKTTMTFDYNLYEGYEHRRTIGFEEGISQPNNKELAQVECKTYVFTLPSSDSTYDSTSNATSVEALDD